MAEGNDDAPPRYIDRGFGKKKRRSTVDSTLGSRSLEQTWLAERERAAKEGVSPAPKPDADPDEW